MRQRRQPIRLIALLVTLLFMCLPKIVQAGPLSSPLISSYNPPFAQANTWDKLQTFSAGLTVSGGQVLVPNGTAVAPSYSFANDVDTGFYWNSAAANTIYIALGGVNNSRFGPGGGLDLGSDGVLQWYPGNNFAGSSPDVILLRDAANTLAQRNGTNAQESRIFATYTSATQQHYMALKTAKTTLSAVSGATVTATSLIPDGAFVIGVTTRVNTGLGVSLGTTGYTVGDGTDVDRWGAIVGTAAGTDSDNVDATANPTGAFTAANNVVLTATGGNFDGTGDIEVAVLYLTANAD